MKTNNHSGRAALLSFLFCGLGQLYNGDIAKGLVVMFFTVLSLVTNVVGAVVLYAYFVTPLAGAVLWIGGGILFFGLLSIAVLGVYSIVDAYKQGRKYDN